MGDGRKREPIDEMIDAHVWMLRRAKRKASKRKKSAPSSYLRLWVRRLPQAKLPQG